MEADLFKQACAGNVEEVRDLLRSGVDVNVKDGENGCTALSAASSLGLIHVVRALLNHNMVDVKSEDNYGHTALIMASWNGHWEVVRALLQCPDVDANKQNHLGWSALICASAFGKSTVVRALLNHEGVDVNAKDEAGDTSLILASYNGHLNVVRALLCRVDVNLKNRMGKTALDVARDCEKRDVVHRLEKHIGVEGNKRNAQEEQKRREEGQRYRLKNAESKQAMEDKRRRLDSAGSAVEQRVTADPRRRNDNCSSNIEQDRNKLRDVMDIPSTGPVEVSVDFIEACINKDHDGKPIKLGSGTFGDVFLAEDSPQGKKFAVKIIRPTKCDEDAIEEIRQTFQTELSTLKTFRHPNIIALYGYSLNANNSLQCLVYEYAAYGSLADFFADDRKRSCLSAGIRLSIMFQMARAVHFLHSGCCTVAGKNWKVFHRDIKSANICLADDFIPRLIDFGLAELVPDENSDMSVEWGRAFGPAFGTPGYMCPEYLETKRKGLACPFLAAYDVYSIGVVLVELILFRLNGGQSTRYGTQFLDVFETYVQDERHQPIIKGWKKLKHDADPSNEWNPDALKLVCKAAIKCMHPSSEERLSTQDLLDMLRDAIRLSTNADIQHSKAATAVDSDPCCVICCGYRTDIQCSKGHALCTACIAAKLGDVSGRQLSCLIEGCSSQPFPDNVLKGCIPVGTFKLYEEKRTGRKVAAKVSSDLKRHSLV